MKSNYIIREQDSEKVVIEDLGPWDQYASVTNNAEGVVAEMASMLSGRRLLYIDSDGSKDELVHKDGKFVCFKFL